MKRSLLLNLLLVFCFQAIVAQQYTVKGKVVDDQNIPLPGATITIKNTSQGVSSDMSGDYSIFINTGDTLVISMIGMKTQIIPFIGQSEVNVALSTEIQELDEVRVIGYGTQRQKDLTAPIVTIKGDELNKQVSSNPMQALQGKISGVQIINKGAPGAGPTVKIRGMGSIGDYANPLYVVDGIFMENIDFLNTGDIEELTVLKDASAAAIYGVRAANGVVIITTKKGKSGKPVVSYEGYYGVQVPVNVLPLASKDQYVELLNEANANATGYVPKDPANYPTSTDWFREMVRTAPMSNHNIEVSGSTEKTSYSFGGNYLYQEGIMNSDNNFERLNIRGRIEQEINSFIKFGFSTIISKYTKNLPNDNTFSVAYVNPPVYPVYDTANSQAYPVYFGSPQQYGFGNQYANPVAYAYYYDKLEKGNKIIVNSFLEFELIKNRLEFRTSYNQNYNNWTTRDFQPEYYVGGSQGIRSSSLTSTFLKSSYQIIDNLLTYKNRINRHSFSILLGQSTRMERTGELNGSALDVSGYDEQSKYLITGSYKDRNAWDKGTSYNGLSFFTRGTYNYKDKYLATLTFRADGSSKYQEKWGYFPSVGLGWTLTEEKFLKNQNKLQYLKLRASWGQLGNDNIPANSAYIQGKTGAVSSGVFGDKLVDGVGAQTVYQNFLKWEVISEFDIGIDFTTTRTKLSGEIDYYHRITNNVVFKVPISSGGGEIELLDNNGSVLNNGIELSLNWKDKFSDHFNYTLGFNATTIHNEVLKLEGKDIIPGGLIRGNYTTRTAVGHPIGAFYGYEIAGVYESESEALRDPVSQAIKDKGFFKYKDQNGDNVINENDRVYLGSPIPWLIAGIDFGLYYRDFDFGLTLQGQLGNKVLNAKRMNRDIFADGNYDKDFYENRWTQENKSDKYPSAEAYNYSYTQQANDFFVENASYIRIQNVQLGFTTHKIKFLSSLRIFVSAQRPFTFFTYKGFTPEVSGEPIKNGIDEYVYPMQAVYTVGLKMNL